MSNVDWNAELSTVRDQYIAAGLNPEAASKAAADLIGFRQTVAGRRDLTLVEHRTELTETPDGDPLGVEQIVTGRHPRFVDDAGHLAADRTTTHREDNNA